MRKKFRVHLRGGTTLIIRAKEFRVKWDTTTGKVTEWSADDAARWVTFMPHDLVAVERIGWFK